MSATTNAQAKSTKPARAAKSAAAVQAPAPMFAQLVAAPTPAAAPAAPAPKVHEIAVGSETLRTANHVTTLKGTGNVCPPSFAAVTYKLGSKAYNPKVGTFTTLQWAAFTKAIAANGGKATGAQIWDTAVEMGFSPTGLASLQGFGPYRAKPGNLVQA